MMKFCSVVHPETMSLLALLLGLFLIQSTQPATLGQISSGVRFVIAFPENIAHYHPTPPDNKIQITSLYHNNNVEVSSVLNEPQKLQLNIGQTDVVDVPPQLELQKLEISNKAVQISSNRPITVRAINHKSQSIQTSLVLSVDNLGRKYKIPPVPRTNTATDSLVAPIPSDISERGPFKVIIVNTDVDNTVTMTGAKVQSASLTPFQLALFWVTEGEGDAAYEVEADKPVSVLVAHPCTNIFNCTCGMLVTPLVPTSDTKLNFFIPPHLAKDVEDEMSLLVPDHKSGGLVPYDPDHPKVKSSGPVVFYRPGLLLRIIPEEDFSSCFVLDSDIDIEGLQSYALVVVHRVQVSGVRRGSTALPSPEWSAIKGTEYVSTHVEMSRGKNIFWHTTSVMAVYHMGSTDSQLFGNPAPAVSKSADVRGCVLVPDILEVGDERMGWPESVQYCRGRALTLVSVDAPVLKLLAERLHRLNHRLKQAWIGLRRRSLTGEWYWVSGAPVSSTHWGHGEPGGPEDGQCAIMSLEPKKDFSWKDESCCTAAVPVCYRSPEFLPLN